MNKLDFTALAQRLLISADTLVPQWLAGGRRRGHEWVCGDLAGGEGDSCSVNLLSGRWADFATSERGGDLISLYAAIQEITMGEAYRELSDEAPASECPDGPRYKALGNSWAVPVVRWIGRRINRSLEATP